ncbi:MAG TPA: 30S ribosomal protein S3 [Dehalococcoidia bacterium]|nr:30S ribosomal protein S3 [Dehalococcoidia bacterium]
MGHKVHPMGFRLGVIKDWQSKWYSDTNYDEFVLEDVKLRETIRKKYPEAAISLIEIDRQAKDVTITLYTARPGIVIGRGGQRVDEMRAYLEGLVGKKIRLNIQEVRQPELDAYLVARSVAEQIERRIAYRRAMKQAIFRTIQAGAKGIKVSCAGRLGNAEIARRQTSHEGQVPLHTLRADIDYGFTEAHTTLGRIGVKVWIYKGQILPEPKAEEIEEIHAETAVAEAEAVVETVEEEKPTEAVAEEPEAVVEAAEEEKATEAVAEEPEAAVEEPEAEKKPARATAKKTTRAAAVKKTETKTVKTTAKTKEKSTEEAEEKPAAKKARKTTRTKKAAEKKEVTAEAETPDETKEEDKDAAA